MATDQQSGIVQTTRTNTLFPLTGTVLEETRVLGAAVLSDTVNSYASLPATPIFGQPTFVYLATSTTTGRELDGTALPTTTTTNANPDAYGNIQDISVGVSDGSSTATHNTFANDTTRWLLGRLTSTTVTSVVGSSTITRSSSFGYDPATGILTEEVIEPGANACNGIGASCRLQTDYTLDGFGHRRIATVSGPGIATRSTSMSYDANGTFAVQTTNALGQPESFDYSGPGGAAFGMPTAHTDLNADTTSFATDSFGRRVLTTLPFADGTKSAVAYSYCTGVNGGSASCPTGAAFMVQTTPYAHDGVTQNGPATRTFFDILSRAIASDVQGFDGAGTGCTATAPCWIRTETVYDDHGFVARTSRPYFAGTGTPQWTTYSYDPIGRPLTVTAPDGSVTTYTYTGLGSAGGQTTVTDALGRATITRRNAQGLDSSVINALNKTTSYIYDAYGNLLTVSDPAGNHVASTYDIRGHKLTTSDPDMGVWHYSYDVLGELLTQTDAKNQTTSFANADGSPAYDLLGRPLRRTENDLTSTWSYDTAANGIGMLASATGTAASYSRNLRYDNHSRPWKVTLTINGVAHVYVATYNSDWRLDTLTYPDGLAVKYVYTPLGFLQQLRDNTTQAVLWTANARDAELHLTDQSAGNADRTIQVYDPMTGRVQQIRASRNGADDGGLAHLDYTFDAIGNLTSRSDAFGVGEQFCYDALNRLTNYSVGGATCTSGSIAKTVGYDDLGNITNKSDVGAYTYAAGGQPLPHAVKSIAGTVNGILNPKYKYDPNGNLICMFTGTSCVGSGIVRESDTYWSFNMTKTVTEGTTSVAFVYDSEHSRITQTVASGSTSTTTTYLNDTIGGAMSEKVVSGGITTWNDYIKADGMLVGERSCVGAAPCIGTASTWQYFVTDHLGSVSVATDGTTGSPTYGQVTSRMAFDPWGRQRNIDGTDDATCSLGMSNPTTRGFTGHETIPSLCLVNMNARLYDPTIARFMAPDSIIPDPNDGQSYNRYTYVDNGPLSATDPTGHDPSWFDANTNPDHWTGNNGAHADSDAHPEMEQIGGFSVTKTSFGDGSAKFSISYNSDGEQAFDQHKEPKGTVGLSTNSTSRETSSASDPQITNQTASAQNAQASTSETDSNGVETVVVHAGVTSGTHVGPAFTGYSGDFSWAYQEYTNKAAVHGEDMNIRYFGKKNGLQAIQRWRGWGDKHPEYDGKWRPDMTRGSDAPYYDSHNSLLLDPGEFRDTPGTYQDTASFRAETMFVQVDDKGGYKPLAFFAWGFDYSNGQMRMLPVQTLPTPRQFP